MLGDVLRKSAVSRITRTLGRLISSGVSILDGLEITARTSGNRVIQNAIMASRASIAGGETIAGAAAEVGGRSERLKFVRPGGIRSACWRYLPIQTKHFNGTCAAG